MSLVGPRPQAPEVVQYYSPEEMTKFTVRPWITGLAQTCGRGILNWGETLAWLTLARGRTSVGWLAIASRLGLANRSNVQRLSVSSLCSTRPRQVVLLRSSKRLIADHPPSSHGSVILDRQLGFDHSDAIEPITARRNIERVAKRPSAALVEFLVDQT